MSSDLLKTVTASWETEYVDEVWQRVEKVGIPSKRGKRSLWFVGPVLPDANESRLAEVAVHSHEATDDEPAIIHWSLNVRPPPDSDPPDEALERDQRVGGREGLSQLLADGFSGFTSQVALFSITLRLGRTRYACRVLPRKIQRGSEHEPALVLADSTSLEQVGYRFEDGASGLQEVTIVYLHQENEYSVRIQAKGHLKLGISTWLPYADEIAELIVGTFFRIEEDVG